MPTETEILLQAIEDEASHQAANGSVISGVISDALSRIAREARERIFIKDRDANESI
jgi:hypothetical protein